MRFFIRISNTIDRNTHKKNVAALAAAFIVVVLIMNISPIGTPALMKLSGGIGMLDMKLGYSAAQAYDMLYNMGASSRNLYVILLCLDLLFAVVFMLLSSILISILIRKSAVSERFKALNMLPFASGIFDIIENCFILALLFTYPAEAALLAEISSIITILKWIMYGTVSILMFLLAALTVRKSITSKTKSEKWSDKL